MPNPSPAAAEQWHQLSPKWASAWLPLPQSLQALAQSSLFGRHLSKTVDLNGRHSCTFGPCNVHPALVLMRLACTIPLPTPFPTSLSGKQYYRTTILQGALLVVSLVTLVGKQSSSVLLQSLSCSAAQCPCSEKHKGTGIQFAAHESRVPEGGASTSPLSSVISQL